MSDVGLKKLQEEQGKLQKLQELERPGGAKEAEVFGGEAAGEAAGASRRC